MYSIPAHKQIDPMKKPGQIKQDVTLADYIARKSKEKLTFDEWYMQNFIANRVNGIMRKDNLRLDEACELAWNAGQDNM